MSDRTLLFLCKPDEEQILLALKKRGFGEGKWNGVGGKIEEGETIEEAAIRETKEEIGVDVARAALEKVAVIDFVFKDKPEVVLKGHVFFTKEWSGEPVETEEMRPVWYPTNALPFDRMWVDDPLWLPRVLRGERLKAYFLFSADGKRVLDNKIDLVV